MKTIKVYECVCGEDFYEDDEVCVNCGRPVDNAKFRDERLVTIKYTKNSFGEKPCH